MFMKISTDFSQAGNSNLPRCCLTSVGSHNRKQQVVFSWLHSSISTSVYFSGLCMRLPSALNTRLTLLLPLKFQLLRGYLVWPMPSSCTFFQYHYSFLHWIYFAILALIHVQNWYHCLGWRKYRAFEFSLPSFYFPVEHLPTMPFSKILSFSLHPFELPHLEYMHPNRVLGWS